MKFFHLVASLFLSYSPPSFQALYAAGEAKLGTDESRFNSILAVQSYEQLRVVFEEYQKVSKHTIEQAISSEMSGDLKDGMLAIGKA